MATEASQAGRRSLSSTAHHAWGLAILNLVVPTAATAGLLIVMARTLDNAVWMAPWELDYQLFLGWFAAILFVISTGHGLELNGNQSLSGIVLDVVETFSMVGAFHALGLVLGTDAVVPNRPFFGWFSCYLVAVITRRACTGKWPTRQDRVGQMIVGLAIVVAVMTGLTALFYWNVAPKWTHFGNVSAWILWVGLLLYLAATFARERRKAG